MQNLPQVIDSYNWSSPEILECPTCEAARWQADQSRTFIVNVFDENGCKTTDTVLYRVTGGCKDDIFIPNGFTPNGDEVNDELFIRSVHEVSLKYFRILIAGELKYILQMTSRRLGWKPSGRMEWIL